MASLFERVDKLSTLLLFPVPIVAETTSKTKAGTKNPKN